MNLIQTILGVKPFVLIEIDDTNEESIHTSVTFGGGMNEDEAFALLEEIVEHQRGSQ